MRLLVRPLTTQRVKKVLALLDESQRAALVEMVLEQRSDEGFALDMQSDLQADTLAAVQAPTLVIHSRNDGSINVDQATRAGKLIANSEVELVDTWGHLIWLDESFPGIKNRAAAFL